MLIHEQRTNAGVTERLRRLFGSGVVISAARPSRSAVSDLARRLGWFLNGLTGRRAKNLLQSAVDLVLAPEQVNTVPALVKIDISPLCNLKCTACVHATPGSDPALQEQDFHAGQVMHVDDYSRIIEQLRGRASAVSLYYLGDPLVHPRLEQLCQIAHDAGLNVHLSTNFSFGLSDERIEALVTCGVTHFTVCVDGMTQELYERTRVGGRIEVVLNNLQRLCAIRGRLSRHIPRVEVQYIKYRHNEHQVNEARELCARLGVDQFTVFWGNLHNYVDRGVHNYRIKKPKRALPLGTHCYWPFAATLIKYNGDVIPCCNHRLDEQYRYGMRSRVLGNVFAQPVREIWNSAAYRQIRRLARNPELALAEAEMKESFCYGCVRLFETTCSEDAERTGDQYDYSDFFATDARGRPVRRLKMVQAPS